MLHTMCICCIIVCICCITVHTYIHVCMSTYVHIDIRVYCVYIDACVLVIGALILQKVQQNGYSTTRDFLADTEWIHHNCIIFNGG